MEENLKWVWAAFSIAWLLHVGYLTLLSSRAKDIERQFDDLKTQVRESSDTSEDSDQI